MLTPCNWVGLLSSTSLEPFFIDDINASAYAVVHIYISITGQ